MTPSKIFTKSELAYSLKAFDYHLPDALIAQHPPAQRGDSRLLTVGRDDGLVQIGRFEDIVDLLPRRALIVVNNSTVIPGRLRGISEHGGAMEMLILTPLVLLGRDQIKEGGKTRVRASVLLRPSRKAVPGKMFRFGDLLVSVLRKDTFGRAEVELFWNSEVTLEQILLSSGEIPLPPYIQRPPNQDDRERYQTVYASAAEAGSIAAPTAGLHMTPLLRERLTLAGHEWTEVTLFVGYGTFSPIRVQDIREHQIHAEYVKIPLQAVEAIHRAKGEGRQVIGVGTTSMRSLEGVAEVRGTLEPYEGWLDTYIQPGFRFQVVDGLITNFHLPQSSLLVLVSAFAGRERILAAYRQAVAEGFRFFSYGDAMFIRP